MILYPHPGTSSRVPSALRVCRPSVGIQFTVAAVGRARESDVFSVQGQSGCLFKGSLVYTKKESVDSKLAGTHSLGLSLFEGFCGVSRASISILSRQAHAQDTPQGRHGSSWPCALELTPARKAFLVQLRALALEKPGGGSRTKRSQSTVRSLMEGDDSQRVLARRQ